jgi:transposase
MRLFKDRHQMSGCLVVDRGIVTHGNVKEIVDERGIDLVGGLRMDNSVKRRVKDIPLDAYGPEFKCGKEVLRACELSLPILGKPRRCILYFSGDKAERDKKDRARRMNEVETQLADISTSLLRKGRGCKRKRDPLVSLIDQLLREKDCTHLFEWRFTGGRGGRRLKWKRNEDAIHEQEKLDGKYVLITTLSDPPGVILQIYRNRDRIERAFRITKEAIRIRPIWNRKESHIKAHLFICFLSYLLMSLLQRSLKEVEPGLTSVKALKRLSVLTRRVDRKITLPGGAKSLLKKLVILKR